MFGRAKKYTAKFWCSNCGKNLKIGLPFGIMPILDGELTHLYDVHNFQLVNGRGVRTGGKEHIFCPNCGSYELNQIKWVPRSKG
jgi:predicted RNA-binding Zn-ribbon protein involved in translation (DUF1610 family)